MVIRTSASSPVSGEYSVAQGSRDDMQKLPGVVSATLGVPSGCWLSFSPVSTTPGGNQLEERALRPTLGLAWVIHMASDGAGA